MNEAVTTLVTLVRRIGAEYNKAYKALGEVGINMDNELMFPTFPLSDAILDLMGFPKDNTVEKDMEGDDCFCRDFYSNLIVGDTFGNEELVPEKDVYGRLVAVLNEFREHNPGVIERLIKEQQ